MRTVRRKVGGVVKRVRVCRFKEGFRGLLATKRPGPAPGSCTKA